MENFLASDSGRGCRYGLVCVSLSQSEGNAGTLQSSPDGGQSPYRYVRNPMLTGVFLFLFGVGLCINSVSLVIFLTPLFVLVNVLELKEIEEPELVKRLGDEYIEYRRQTPMFIPEHRPRNLIPDRLLRRLGPSSALTGENRR